MREGQETEVFSLLCCKKPWLQDDPAPEMSARMRQLLRSLGLQPALKRHYWKSLPRYLVVLPNQQESQICS